MSSIFILTQDDFVLNVDKVIHIGLSTGIYHDNVEDKDVEAYEITATVSDLEENPLSLGFYFEEDEVIAVMENLVDWLSSVSKSEFVFRMPLNSEESNNSKLSSDETNPSPFENKTDMFFSFSKDSSEEDSGGLELDLNSSDNEVLIFGSENAQ